jgi:hypothetical protein
MRKVIAPEVANIAMKITGATTTGRPSSAINGARRRMFEIARRMVRVENDGRTNRWW